MKVLVNALAALLLALVAVLLYVRHAENQSAAMVSVVKVGVLPDESPGSLRDRFEPLLDYLSAETGLEFTLVGCSDYNELVGLFVTDAVDLAYFGGYTFVQASVLHDAEPLIMREIDTRFTSYFLASGDVSGNGLDDFRNKTFSFGNRLSTSGHLMPRHYLQQYHGLVPEEYFAQVRFSGTHDATAYLVRDKEVDLGVANAAIVRAMVEDGRLGEKDLRIVWETPPYPDYVWAVQSQLPEAVKTRIRDAFLGLNASDGDEKRILDSLGAELFLPAAISDFSALREVADSMQLLSPKTP